MIELAWMAGGAAVALGAVWAKTRHRSSHREIVVLDDFERDGNAMTLITHTACAECGERQRLPEIHSAGVEELRRAQAGEQ